MAISEEDLDEFNRQVDIIRDELLTKAVETKSILLSTRLADIANKMELSRRVFESFALTGKVEIPD